MALPVSGNITASMINIEIGRASTDPFSMNDSLVRSLANKPSGAISFSDFYGKSLKAFNISPAVSGKTFWNLSTDGLLNLNTPGIWYITPISNVNVGFNLWGSGGAASNNNHGGGGGFAWGNFTLVDGNQYVLVVGAPGVFSSTIYQEPYGGGQPGNTNAGQGGGLVGIFSNSVSQANAIAIAGGGGGGGVNGGPGAGGGSSGQRGGGNWGGYPGTQTAGGNVGWAGEPPFTPNNGGTGGGALVAGKGGTGSGGGGNGYYGGGGGDGNSGNRSGGGGGSGYVHSSLVTSAWLDTGNRRTPGNADYFRRDGAGDGGLSGSGSGSTGRLIIHDI